MWRNGLLLALVWCWAAVGMGRRPDNGIGGGIIPDTLRHEGPVMSVHADSGFIVLDDVFDQDTIYYTDSTLFPAGERANLLKPGAEVRLWYIRRNQRNYAVRIEHRDRATPLAPGQQEYESIDTLRRENPPR